MKFIKNLSVLFTALLILGTATQAQIVSVLEGNPKDLKEIKSWNIAFDFSEVTAARKRIPEADHVRIKSGELNEKEAGKGDMWAEEWEASKKTRYAPKFELLLNETLAKYDIKFKVGDESAAGTITAKTTWINAGFAVGVAKQPALMDGIYTFEKDGKTLLVVKIEKAVGDIYMGNFTGDFTRIAESYAMAGKSLGKLLKKKAYK